jgi:hypothetical protein
LTFLGDRDPDNVEAVETDSESEGEISDVMENSDEDRLFSFGGKYNIFF